MALTNTEIDIASYIDHALLRPDATPEQVEQCCFEADQYNFSAVCLYPNAVCQAVEFLYHKSPQICTVIGFPTGAVTSNVKLFEAQEAIDNGATELDVVINIGWLKAGKIDQIHQEMAQICEQTDKTIKAIIETGLLTDGEKRLAAEICMDAGAAFIKTNTGWFGGATTADVRLLKEVTKGRIGIKASGGIRSLQQALDLIEAGATRLGTSRGVDLIRQQEEGE